MSAKSINILSSVWNRGYVQRSRNYSEEMSSFPCSNLPPDGLQESSCCCVPAWPSDLGGTGKCQGSRVDLFFCKGKIRKNRMGEEHKLLFDFSLPWEYFSSGSQMEKNPAQTQEKPTAAKRRELEAIFCSLIWQHYSLLSSKAGAFPVAMGGWILYTHPQRRAGLE